MHNTPSQGLLDFLKRSPSPFHATQSMAEALQAAGYQALDERETWQLQPQGRYYVTRNDSSIIAIKLGQHDPVQHGIRMVGAHTDSPCLKVKPQPELARHGYWQLGVEVYGGVLLSPWFDRDLSLAGRVTFKHNEQLQSRLIDFKHAIASIPSLAIHLNREANSGWAINAQTELPPVLAQLQGETKQDFRALLADQLQREHAISDACVLDYELCFYDSQPAALIGLNQDFIARAMISTAKFWSVRTTKKSVPTLLVALTAHSSNKCYAAYSTQKKILCAAFSTRC